MDYQQSDWVILLPFVQYIYNNLLQSSTGESPFKVIQGFKGKSIPGLEDLEKVMDGDLNNWWTQGVENWVVVEKELTKAKEDYKKYVVLKHSQTEN